MHRAPIFALLLPLLIAAAAAHAELDIFQRGAGGCRAAGRVRTAPGARTSLFVPELERLYVAAPALVSGSAARLLVFRPLP